MSISREKLEKFLNDLYQISEYEDFGPNGLQIEGKKSIKKVALAVSATKDSVLKAQNLKVDALIVHHGLFWKFHSTKTITGSFAKRVIPLIKNSINLFSYHLPMDGHQNIGHAACIAKKLGLKNLDPFGEYKKATTGIKGTFEKSISANELEAKIKKILKHDVIVAAPDEKKSISSLGIITGGAGGHFSEAVTEGLDAYLTGEISEHNWHESREDGIYMFAAGHNATEEFGVKALKEILVNSFGLECHFIPSKNPA